MSVPSNERTPRAHGPGRSRQVSCPTGGTGLGQHSGRAVIYLRVSTIEQAEKGLGLKVQRQACADLCAASGLQVVGVCADEGISGAEQVDNRAGLVEAIGMLQSGEADTVVVYRLDRLARDVILQETLLQQVWSTGASVVSCSAQETTLAAADDPDDPARTLVRQILAAVAQYERSMIRLRMRSGKRRALRDRVFAGGTVPFGWEPDKSSRMGLREVWVEQATLQRARALHDVDNLSWSDVAAQLNAEGLYRRGNVPWGDQQIRRNVATDLRLRDELAALR